MIMVYYSDTFELCHPLTKKGEESYQHILELAADEILFKSQHPVKWFFNWIFSWFKK